MTRNTLLLGILLLFNSFLFSQDNCQLSISGKVIDEHDQSALSFSNIYILESHKGVVADLNGDFSLRGLCAIKAKQNQKAHNQSAVTLYELPDPNKRPFRFHGDESFQQE